MPMAEPKATVATWLSTCFMVSCRARLGTSCMHRADQQAFTNTTRPSELIAVYRSSKSCILQT